MNNIIDFHIHAGDFPQLREDIQDLIQKIPLENGADVKELFSNGEAMSAYLQNAGVSTGIILAECGPGTNYSITSEMIANRCKDNNSLVPFGSVNPNYHKDPIAEFHKSIEAGVRGFKFYPADHGFDALSSDMMEIYKLCEQHGVVIMFHTGFTAQKDTEQMYCNPADFIPIFEACPELAVVLCHAGKPHWYKESVEVITKYPNAFIDTALVPIDVVTELVRSNPKVVDKVLFGSDWPVCGNYEALVERYLHSGLSEVQLQKIMRTNALSLLTRRDF
ncbi:amidohydrolase [Pseudoalteromonas sp. L23]|uniref:amidohydrolase family protein n=1 Tax=unclassified Pseudoalteromonas TaxID=194690 RepID=UPI001EF0FAE8|nr:MULTISPECIES: amidohydrolase family protein [unclassified Pseudoalteromonas]MCF7516425.1 amidohydrolase [Pseudoalteromonas sp. L7]MCF7528447.1 amidohydrolase [Pseudoalteromonas sp. L23]MCX2769564.1 amidohydrolase family protein [Pseudoalteromonas sp. B530]